MTSPHDVLSIVEAGRGEHGLEFAPDLNPFRHLQEPLKAAVNQVGQAYLDAISAAMSGNSTRRARQSLNCDDLLPSQPDLFSLFNEWVELPSPSDATRRAGMRDSVRVMNQLAPTRAEPGQLVQVLTTPPEAAQAEGLDRPIVRPETRTRSVEDLESVVDFDGIPARWSDDSTGSTQSVSQMGDD